MKSDSNPPSSHPAFMPAAEFAALIDRQQGELLRLMQRMGLTGDLR